MESPICGSEPGLTLIETLLWDGTALVRLPRHLARLARSAARLGWACDLDTAESTLLSACPQGPARMRLTLDAQGQLAATGGGLAPTPLLWRFGIAAERLDAADPWLGIKSSRRALYDHTRAALPEGLEELIFLNQRGEVCEGTITNVFYDLGDGLCTPPVECGLLPGILRESLLATGQCQTRPLLAQDLGQARIWLGNSLRGLIPAQLVG